MRLFLFAFVLALLFLGCSDGKFNLSLVLWGADEDTEEEYYYSSSSGNSLPPSSSSSSGIPPVSSSLIPSSSGEETSSSSSEEPPSSSSSRPEGIRSSSSKPYEEYDPPIPGEPGTNKGWASRYWDGCKPHCSLFKSIVLDNNYQVTRKPWTGICKNCNKNNEEVTTYEKHPTWVENGTSEWFAGYLNTPSSCEGDAPNATYVCWDMIPIAINDTLAYGFAAVNSENTQCGKCYQLTFDGGWHNDVPRVTHRALKGKTMIVMASNIGKDVTKDEGQFDIMIPGGGVGAFNSISGQLGISATGDELEEIMGKTMGGLLSNCQGSDGKIAQMYGVRDGDHRATLEQWQGCLRSECTRLFGTPGRELLLKGCMWMADWYMAADNPTFNYKEVECPKYLTDKYYSSVDVEPPPLPDPYPRTNLCIMGDGGIDCKATGWYD